MNETAYLRITTPVIVAVVDFLTIGKADAHIVSLNTYIPAVHEHGELNTSTEIVGRLTLRLYIIIGTETHEHLLFMQEFGVTLGKRHSTIRLVGKATCIEQRRDVEVVADGLGSAILTSTRTIPQTDLITKPIGNETMHLNTKVEARANARGNGIERVRQNGRGGQ